MTVTMLEQDTEDTRVVFRVWTRSQYQRGEVIALFPDVDEGRGTCSSYMHVGQHGGADYMGCIYRTRPATEEEYKPLATELESIGYKLRVVKRR